MIEGKFKPKYPNKYKGDVNNIIYRSSYELKYMMLLDHDKNVINWGSETIIIPYRSPKDNKIHRYFMDFIVTRINSNGKKETVLIEIKPYKQTIPPKKPKSNKNKKFLLDSITYAINKAKWIAAEEFVADRGWKFEILTEVELKIPNWKK